MGQRFSSVLWGLFFLRVGLGLFMAMWAIDKFVAPEKTVELFSRFYFLDINPSIAMMIGGVQLVISLLIVFGMYKTMTYGAGFLIHALSTASTYEFILVPFGNNHVFIASLPILLAFIALFLMRGVDTKWTLGKKKSLFS